jgi:hypothetical protein
MPALPSDRPLGAFLEELERQDIPCILIGAMAAILQGAPLMTVDFGFWLRLPVRAHVKVLSIVRRQGGVIRARTLYELSDGTQVNIILRPDGLRSFEIEWKKCVEGKIEGVPVRLLPLDRIMASKRAAGRPQDIAALPAIEETLRCAKKLKSRRHPRGK